LTSQSCSEQFNETSTGTRALIIKNLFFSKFYLDMNFLICNNYILVMFTMIETLKNILKEKGIKPTYQRLKILDYMSQNIRNHPTVDMIYAELAKEIPTISMTTVYNTLSTFIEKGLVCGVTITGTEVRYDFNTESHHHFLCKKCGQIKDIDIPCSLAAKKGELVDGHRLEEIHGYFKGTCRDCLERFKV
jgi:Fe2+ or Zn2+ uptake regulation protein